MSDRISALSARTYDFRGLSRGRSRTVSWPDLPCRQAVDQLQGRKPQLGAPIGQRLGEAIDELPVADQSIEVSVVNGKQQAAFSVGDSKCVLVNDAIQCTPVVLASN